MDAFWSRETSIFSDNFRRLRRDYVDSVKVLRIIRPVRKGKCKDQLQWDSMRRNHTWYNKEWEVGVGSSKAG